MVTPIDGRDAEHAAMSFTCGNGTARVFWERHFFGVKPKWVVDPDEGEIKKIACKIFGVDSADDSYSCSFLAKGAFNEVWLLHSLGRELIARVSLPVDPYFKTVSEVATVRWVAKHTDLPLPTIHSFNSDDSNSLSFEYMVMSKVPGKNLAESWRTTSLEAKKEITRQVAKFCAQTLQNQFAGIGSLFSGRAEVLDVKDDEGFVLGRMVSRDFVWDNRAYEATTERGPFRGGFGWLSAQIRVMQHSTEERIRRIQSRSLDNLPARNCEGSDEDGRGDRPDHGNGDHGSGDHENGDHENDDHESGDSDSYVAAGSRDMDGNCDANDEQDPDDIEDLDLMLSILSRLKEKLPKVFDPSPEQREASMIYNDDLEARNIMINEEGHLSGVIDWERVSVVPLWHACKLPELIRGEDLDTEPDQELYARPYNGETPDVYWEDQAQYELTQLRKVFFEAMKDLEPRWLDVYNSSQRWRDFDLAIGLCDAVFSRQSIVEWLDHMDACDGLVTRLEDRLRD